MSNTDFTTRSASGVRERKAVHVFNKTAAILLIESSLVKVFWMIEERHLR
jgi:hypothetical protein